MQNIYYNSGSQSLAVIYENSVPSTLDGIYTLYGITNLEVSSSGQISIFSGSEIVAAFPTSTTNLFFGSVEEYGSGNYIVTYESQSIQITSSSIAITYDVTTPYLPISNSYLQISKSGSIYNFIPNSTGTTYVDNGETYQVYLQADSSFPYDLYLKIRDTATGLTVFEDTSQNTYISTSLYIQPGDLFPKEFTAFVNHLPGISITLTNISSSSVIPPTDVSGWNSYLGISASYVTVSGSNILLTGYALSNPLNLQLSSSFISEFKTNALTLIQSLTLASNSLDSIDVSQYPVLELLDHSYNNFTSSVNIDNNSRLQQYICDNNNISGSLPELYPKPSLTKFSCKNNHFTGSIPNLSNNVNLQYFDCSNNKISGSLPYFPINGFLKEFYCHDNFISGTLQRFNNNLSLTSINCSNNLFSGDIYLQFIPNLSYFSASNNNFSGSLQSLAGCGNLQTFNISNNYVSNYVSGSIPKSLTYFNAENNNLSESNIGGIVKDVYEAGAFNGYLNLSGSGNESASLATLITASILEIQRNWDIELNGTPTIISTSFFDNLGGILIVPGITDGLTSSYYTVVDTTTPLTYINYTGSIPLTTALFRVPDSRSFYADISGWAFTSGSTVLNYTSSIEIIQVGPSSSTTIFSGIGNNAPIGSSFIFATTASYTYIISGSIEYGGNYYEDLLKYAEAVGVGEPV